MATKKQEKEKNKLQRMLVPWNTGTRYHKSKKDYNRRQKKENLRKELKENF